MKIENETYKNFVESNNATMHDVIAAAIRFEERKLSGLLNAHGGEYEFVYTDEDGEELDSDEQCIVNIYSPCEGAGDYMRARINKVETDGEGFVTVYVTNIDEEYDDTFSFGDILADDIPSVYDWIISDIEYRKENAE